MDQGRSEWAVPDEVSVERYVETFRMRETITSQMQEFQQRITKLQRALDANNGRGEGMAEMLAEAVGVPDIKDKALAFDGVRFRPIEGKPGTIEMSVDESLIEAPAGDQEMT